MLEKILDSSFRKVKEFYISDRFQVQISESFGNYLVEDNDHTIRLRVAPVKITKTVSKEIADDTDMLGFRKYATQYSQVSEIDMGLLRGSIWKAILTVSHYKRTATFSISENMNMEYYIHLLERNQQLSIPL